MPMSAFSLAATALLLLQQSVIVEQVRKGDDRHADRIEQLSAPEESGVIPPQPSTSDSQPPDSVAQLSQGDTGVEFARVEGFDRCSAELLSAADAAYCARRLESRSEEFATPSPTRLTAEQVLSGERPGSTLRQNVAEASRERAARRDASAEDRELQALASLTLSPSTEPSVPAEGDVTADLPAETQALVEAIVNRLADPGGN